MMTTNIHRFDIKVIRRFDVLMQKLTERIYQIYANNFNMLKAIHNRNCDLCFLLTMC